MEHPPFYVGQQLVRRLYRPRGGKLTYGGTFTVHIVECINGTWTVFDKHLNKFRADECIDVAVYKSLLWEVMQESEK